MQNSAARLITGQKRCDHITGTLIELHWLPIRARIVYKILLLTHKALNGKAPNYLRELLVIKQAVRSSRSAKNETVLVVPAAKLKSGGSRSFSFAAPTIWNHLPIKIRNCVSVYQFKKLLKTHLFDCFYYR